MKLSVMECIQSVGSKHLAPSLILCGRGCSLRWPALFRLDAHNAKISQLKACILLDLTINYLKGSVASAMFQKGKHGRAAKACCRCAALRDTRADETFYLQKNREAMTRPLPSIKMQGRALKLSFMPCFQHQDSNVHHDVKVSLACITCARYYPTELKRRGAIASS